MATAIPKEEETTGLPESRLSFDEIKDLEDEEEAARLDEKEPEEEEEEPVADEVEAPVEDPPTDEVAVEEPTEEGDPSVTFDQLRDTVAELRAEVSYLRGAESTRQTEAPREASQKPAFDRAEWLKRLRAAPDAAIEEIAERSARATEARILGHLEQSRELNRARQIDEQQAQTLYSDVVSDPEVIAVRDKLLKDLEASLGQLFPGATMMTTATAESIVRRRRAAGGKAAAPAAAPANGKPRVPRRPSDHVASRVAAPAPKSNGDLKFSELPAADQRGIRLFVARSNGITIEDYMKNFNRKRKADPTYGRPS
jgi:hypothetical protein